ncbi:tape measure protein [Pediococcus pentosaceus]|uniref:tape measure protein n=1 Tax=Pediococcus pentosaceus TaxID=1255 RepID=UPI00200D253A|nr:tape measure protein [Pediococcus pentosaceus]UQA99974.1 tape measure protein [Pediococcus pentosaceus]UQB01817.1 tape measure protein [Pediococcus pentosaceus]
MGERYSVTAVLSAVDRNFSSVMQKASGSMETMNSKAGGMTKSTSEVGSSITGLITKMAAFAGGAALMGSAVSRFDTLNKYPIVMKGLGYATSDANKSVKTLSNGIDGLPTSLDGITNIAQQLAPLTGGANSAAKAAVALNNAFLASGASASDTSRGLQQYTQMLSTGKVDLMSWRTLQETMPIALRKVAGAFGMTGKSAENDLFKKLQSGEITMDQLNDKFVELNKGQNGFASLAKKNSAGIGTSFANLKTAAVKGIANMISAIDDGFQKAGLPKIATMIDSLKGVVNAAFTTMGNVIVKVVPPIANFVKNVIKLYQTNSIFRNIANAIGIFEIAVMSINSTVAVLTAVGGAIGGMFLATSKATKTVVNFGKGLFSIGKSVTGLVAKLFGVSTGNTAVGATSAGAATGEKAVGKSAEKSAGQLIAMGLAVLEIGAGIALVLGGLALLVLSITQLAKQGMNGVIALVTFGATIAVLAGVFALLGPVLTASAVGLLAFGVAIIGAGAGVALFGAGVLAMGAGLALAGQGVTVLVNAFILLGNNIGLIIPIMSSIGAGFSALLAGILNAVITNIPLIGQTFIALGQTILNVINTLSPQIIQTVMNLLLLLVNTVVTYTPIFTAKIAQLIISILNTITTYLPQIILAGTNLIVALLNGIAQAMPRIITASVNVIVAFINGIANNLGRIINAGINLLAKFIMGIVNTIPRITSIAIKAVMKFVYGVGNALGQVLGSGHKLINMFVKGIIDGFSKSQSSGKGNANHVKSGIKSINLLSVGHDLIQGFINGISDKVHDVVSAAESIGHAAKNTLVKFFHIGSPSRLMRDEVGKWIPAGIAVGMNKNVDWITSAAKNMANAAIISVPSPDFEDFRNGFNRIQSLSSSAFSGSVNGSMTLNASTMDQKNNALLRRIADKNTNLYMDSDTLVGTTSDKFNGQLGATSNNDERWSW